MKQLTFFSALLVFLWLGCNDEPLDINTAAEYTDYLTDEMIDQEIPGLAVLVFKGEDILYEQYLGQSDVAANQQLSANDIFLLASVSKMVTGTALLQLYEDGAFSLDDPINDYLSFNVSVPEETTPITFRMLLTHTSGIADGPNATLFYSYGEDSPIGLASYLEDYLVPTGDYYNANDNFYGFTPGTEHEYSNMASALIGVLVAEIAGQDFTAYCREHIFTPLGMNDTYWSLDAALKSNKTLVKPHEYTSNGQYEAVEHYTFPDYPNGGLRTTARDLMKFLSALAQDGTYRNAELLSASTVDEMLRPQIPALDNTVGLHIFIMDEIDELWGHDGSEEGVSTEVAFNRADDIGVIVLSNLQDVDVTDILLRGYELGRQL
ncbi:MAG: serine hydrolase domain-containing protein [Bacteroidota bacterium]